MKSLLLLSFVAGAAVAFSPPRCNQGWACVENYECIDGVIDTSGAGKFDLRGYSGDPAECSLEGHVCCQIPQRTVQPGCAVHEDCVNRDLCDDGVIVTDGAGLIDLRLGLTEYRQCYNAEFDEEGICCRLPDAPKPVETCADDLVCTGYDFCGDDGTVLETKLDVPLYTGVGTACYLNPGGTSFTTGVCCRPAPVVEPCPQGESCLEKSVCGLDGHISQSTLPEASWYQGQDCYIGFSKVLGTCCKPPKPVEHCPPGGQCTPYNYCSAEGQLTPGPHNGASCADCLKCKVGLGSDSVGVCCGPPPKLPDCAAGNVCTVGQYCDAEGYVVSQPAENIYTSVAQCNLPGGFGYGTCCNPVRPRDYCPLDSECVPADFCVGSILEQGTEDVWHGYGSQKEWHRCSLPGSTNGGICCKNDQPQQCGRSYYANQNINTRFYDPELDKLEADFGELPWQAIVFYSNYTFKCGASLISDKHVLTVAHCVNGLFPYDLRIRLGEWQVNTFDEPLQYQDKDVAAIHIHPDFRRATVWNNIAILELKQPVNFQYNINSICLPTSTDVYARFPPGTRCLASGWGKDSFSGTYQHILKKIDLPLVGYADCQNKLRRTRLGRHFRLHKSYTCAGGEEGRDACVGDGGGPLVCYDATAQQYFQVGITAWGVGCGTKDVPGAYTDVSKFSDWIYEIIALGNKVKEW